MQDVKMQDMKLLHILAVLLLLLLLILSFIIPPPKKKHMKYKIKIIYHTTTWRKSTWRQCVGNNDERPPTAERSLSVDDQSFPRLVSSITGI